MIDSDDPKRNAAGHRGFPFRGRVRAAPSCLPEAVLEPDCPIGRQDIEQTADAAMSRNHLTKCQFEFLETRLPTALSGFA
ncbi:MAG: hypothetical protein OXJ90_25795 [Spirochaetaceae bacterium]|nr:hypothetical protein [Spirochaetaceae bacterium]